MASAVNGARHQHSRRQCQHRSHPSRHPRSRRNHEQFHAPKIDRSSSQSSKHLLSNRLSRNRASSNHTLHRSSSSSSNRRSNCDSKPLSKCNNRSSSKSNNRCSGRCSNGWNNRRSNMHSSSPSNSLNNSIRNKRACTRLETTHLHSLSLNFNKLGRNCNKFNSNSWSRANSISDKSQVTPSRRRRNNSLASLKTFRSPSANNLNKFSRPRLWSARQPPSALQAFLYGERLGHQKSNRSSLLAPSCSQRMSLPSLPCLRSQSH